MIDCIIKSLIDLNQDYKEQAVEVFIDGFSNIFSFTTDKNILKELFINSMDSSLIYVAVYENKVVGIMGIANNKKRTMCFNIEKCKELFGNSKGLYIKKQLTKVMEKPVVKGDKDLYIDYLTTDKNYRGKGVATKLIEFVCNQLEYDECYIEVLSNNIKAKNLYQYLGFTEYKRQYNLFTMLKGLGYLIKLHKSIK